MAKHYDSIEPVFQKFIDTQHMFFVATAASDGRINLSPKGMDSLRVLGPNRVIWRNLTGSGNETAGHLLSSNRITLMWCGFEAKPLILRIYGSARALHPRDAEFATFNQEFPPNPGARQIFDVTVASVQSSCGYAIPYMDYKGERDTLLKWAENKGADGIETHWKTRNSETIDGLPTGIAEPAE